MQSVTKVMVKLETIDKVKNLVGVLSPIEGDFDLVSDRYVVDAKSIMGIFSLDISKPLELHIHNASAVDKVMPLIEPYKV